MQETVNTNLDYFRGFRQGEFLQYPFHRLSGLLVLEPIQNRGGGIV